MMDFSAEQDMLIRLLRQAGVADPEAAVDGQRAAAAYFGSFLLPTILAQAAANIAHDQAMAAAMLRERTAAALDRIESATDRLEAT